MVSTLTAGPTDKPEYIGWLFLGAEGWVKVSRDADADLCFDKTWKIAREQDVDSAMVAQDGITPEEAEKFNKELEWRLKNGI